MAHRWFQLFNTGEEKKNTEDLPCSGRPTLWNIETIHRDLKENPQKNTRRLAEELGASKDNIHRRLRHLENHTEAVDLYLMN